MATEIVLLQLPHHLKAATAVISEVEPAVEYEAELATGSLLNMRLPICLSCC